MSARERFILAAAMSSMMVAVVTLASTWLNVGFTPDFILRWLKAYAVAWPIAALIGFMVLPFARRFTTWVPP
jgi:uncharacterized protein DUF2798